MASWRGLTRARLGVAAVIILLLGGIGYLLPKAPFLNEKALRGEIAARIAAWAGGRAAFSGPFKLHYFPTPYLTTGKLTLEATPNLPRLRTLTAEGATIDLGLWSLVSSQPVFHRITLREPRIALQTQAPEREGEASQPPSLLTLTRALRAAPVPELRLLNGTVTISGPETSERITELDLGLDISFPAGNFEGDGDLQWRGEALSFDFAGVAPPPEADAASDPLTVSLDGPLVAADMEARGSIEDGIRATGSLDLRIADLRRFARWVGLVLPEGRGLETFRASGGFNWNGYRLAFDEGTFSLDGNRALGALALDLAGARPAIEGTLAFSTFDLAQYGAPAEPAAKKEDAGGGEDAPPPLSVDFPLLHHFDVDLRLSTNEVAAASLRLGQVALSATVKAGRLMADFAILDICGGSGSGRFTLDAATPEAPGRLTANMTGLAAKPCLEAFLPRSPIAGDFGLSAELSSQGRTGEEILRHLDGTLTLNAGPGVIGIDLAVLNAPVEAESFDGWKPLMREEGTSFSSVAAELTFREGVISSNHLEIVSGETLYSGRGTLGLPDRMLDLRVLSREAAVETGSGESSPGDDPAAIAELSGPWSAPRIRVRAPGAEAAPQSGDGAKQE